MGVLLMRLGSWVSGHRKAVVGAWVAVILAGGYFAAHQQDNLQGGGWEVPGSQAKRANELLRGFNGFSVAGLAVVVSAPTAGDGKLVVDGDRYRQLVCCAPASSILGAFGREPADVAAQIARDAGSDEELAKDVAAAQPPGPSSTAYGKALSNLCSDVIGLTTAGDVYDVAATVPPAWRPLVENPETVPPLTALSCVEWGVPPGPASQRKPVKSGVPAIVFANEWDHVIYPGEGVGIAQTLGNAKLYRLPGLDHIALLNFRGYDVSCPRKIALAFVDSPASFPSGACTTAMSEPSIAPNR
jgi:hypothetical protein